MIKIISILFIHFDFIMINYRFIKEFVEFQLFKTPQNLNDILHTLFKDLSIDVQNHNNLLIFRKLYFEIKLNTELDEFQLKRLNWLLDTVDKEKEFILSLLKKKIYEWFENQNVSVEDIKEMTILLVRDFGKYTKKYFKIDKVVENLVSCFLRDNLDNLEVNIIDVEDAEEIDRLILESFLKTCEDLAD